MPSLRRDLHQVGYDVIQLLDNPTEGSPQRLRQLFKTLDLPAVLCERGTGSSNDDSSGLELYKCPDQMFQNKVGSVLCSNIEPADISESWVRKMGRFISCDLMQLDPRYCKLFGTRKERAVEVGFTLLVGQTLHISWPEALDIIQQYKQKCQQSHLPGLHLHSAATMSSSIGATPLSSPSCAPLASFLDRFGSISANHFTSSPGAQILMLLRQVQSFYFNRQLAFLRVLKKIFLTAKEYMDSELPENRYDNSGSESPTKQTAALIFHAVRHQFICPKGRCKGNRPLEESNLWTSYVQARKNVLQRPGRTLDRRQSPLKYFQQLLDQQFGTTNGIVPTELIALLAQYDADSAAGAYDIEDVVDEDEVQELQSRIRQANAESFSLTETHLLELLLLWSAMRSTLACGLAVLRKDERAPRNFPSAEAETLQRFAWYCHSQDYLLLLNTFYPSAARRDAPDETPPRCDAPDSLKCLIMLQASNLQHFMSWAHLGPLGNDLHPFNSLYVVSYGAPGEPMDSKTQVAWQDRRRQISSGATYDCWGVVLGVAWQLLTCFQGRTSRFKKYRKSDRERVRNLLQNWDEHFNLDNQLDSDSRSASATGCLNSAISRCQTRDQLDPASSMAPVVASQHARTREALWPLKCSILRDLVVAITAVDPAIVRLSRPVLAVFDCASASEACVVFGAKLWHRKPFRSDHNSLYRIRKCYSTFRSLRGPPTAPAFLLFQRILVFGYEVWQHQDPLELRTNNQTDRGFGVLDSLPFRPDGRNRMELVRMLSAMLPGFNSLPSRSREGRVSVLAAGGISASDVSKAFQKIDEMMRWLPYIEHVHDGVGNEEDVGDFTQNERADFQFGDVWVPCQIVRVHREQDTRHKRGAKVYDIRFQQNQHGAIEEAEQVPRSSLRKYVVSATASVGVSTQDKPMRFELQGGLLWEQSRDSDTRTEHCVRASFPAGDARSTIQSRNLWRDLFEYAEPIHVKAAILSRNPRVNAAAPDVVRAAKSSPLPNWDAFSSDGGDGGELGNVADYFQLIASVLLCSSGCTKSSDNGFIAAMRPDPNRAWYFDDSYKHILESAESFYCFCWRKFLRQELPRTHLTRWMGSCTKLMMACMYMLALRKARTGDSSSADVLFTLLLQSSFCDTVRSVAEFEANADITMTPRGWESGIDEHIDDASTNVAPRFMLTCQALQLFEYYATNFDQPSLLARRGAAQDARRSLRTHFSSLKRVWLATQDVFRSVTDSFKSGELGHVVEGDDDEGFVEQAADSATMVGDDISASAASPVTAGGLCVAIFRSILQRTSRIEEREVLQKVPDSSEIFEDRLETVVASVRAGTSSAEDLLLAIDEAEASGVSRNSPVLLAAKQVLNLDNGSQDSLPADLCGEVEADGSTDAHFCIVGFASFALLTNRWLLESVLRMTTLCIAVAIRGCPHAGMFAFTSGGFHGHGSDLSRAASVRVFSNASSSGLSILRTMFEYLRLRLQLRYGSSLSATELRYFQPSAEDSTIVSRVHEYAREFAPYFRWMAGYLTWDSQEEYAATTLLAGGVPLCQATVGVLTQLKEWCELSPSLFAKGNSVSSAHTGDVDPQAQILPASKPVQFLDLGRGNYKRFGAQMLCLLSDTLFDLECGCENSHLDQAEACLNFAGVVFGGVFRTATPSPGDSTAGTDADFGRASNSLSANGWQPSDSLLTEILAFPSSDLDLLFEDLLHPSDLAGTRDGDRQVLWHQVAIALAPYRETCDEPRKMLREDFQREFTETPHIIVDHEGGLNLKEDSSGPKGYFSGLAPFDKSRSLSELFHKYAKFEKSGKAPSADSDRIPQKTFDVDMFLHHWGLHWSFGQHLTTGSQWSLVSTAALLVVRAAAVLQRNQSSSSSSKASPVLPLLRGALRLSYALVNVQHDRIRLEVTKCHDAAFIKALAQLARMPDKDEPLGFHCKVNGKPERRAVVPYCERLEIAGLALKLLAAKQLQLQGVPLDPDESAWKQHTFHRFLVNTKLALRDALVTTLAQHLCNKTHVESNTVLSALFPSIQKQLQTIYNKSLIDHNVDLNCYRVDTRFAKYGEDYVFDVVGKSDVCRIVICSKCSLDLTVPLDLLLGLEHDLASRPIVTSASDAPLRSHHSSLLSQLRDESLRVGAIVAQGHYVLGLRHYLTVELGQRMGVVQQAVEPQAVKELADVVFKLYRNISDVLSLRVDASQLATIFQQNWWVPDVADSSTRGGSVWSGITDGLGSQGQVRVFDLKDQLFYDRFGSELRSQSSYEATIKAVQSANVVNTVDILDVVQLESPPQSSSVEIDRQRRVQASFSIAVFTCAPSSVFYFLFHLSCLFRTSWTIFNEVSVPTQQVVRHLAF